jgi:diacylglycerol kinase family enzyme
VLVVLVFAGRRSLGLLAAGLAGLTVAVAALWWFLSRRGAFRWLALGLAVLAPVVVLVLCVRARLLWVVVLAVGLGIAAAAAGRAALRALDADVRPGEYEVPPPRRPFLIMNPRSGGGKVGRFGLAEQARALGAEVRLLDGPETADVAALAGDAVDDGADLLGVAGGDGTQALVAGVAAAAGVPFMVISAGTRNHFALDLGLDRENPAGCLQALTDGVEIRVDLGAIGEQTFVNNASFGAYAELVQSPAYRDDKVGTTLDLLPTLLARDAEPQLRARAGSTVIDAPQALLVSNNPYGTRDIAGLGRRSRLDQGVLGVVAVRVTSTVQAVGLLRGRRSAGLRLLLSPSVTVEADAATVPVGVDGEALTLPTPVRCTIRPGALRVRVPRHRPGAPASRHAPNWTRLLRLAGHHRHPAPFPVSSAGPA